MPSPRLPASSFARPTRASTARTSSPSCRRICMGLTTISICFHRTCSRRFCERRMKQRRPARKRWSCGVRANRVANSCMWMIWPRAASFSSSITTRPRSSTLAGGRTFPIRELAELICDIVGFQGELAWDASKPDGTPRKLLDVSKLRSLGWRPTITLREGIAGTYQWFLQNCA